MAHEGPPVDWDAFAETGDDGRFMELLVKLPRERWVERNRDGSTLLHYACYGPNVATAVALVQSGLVDVNTRDKRGRTPALWAAQYTQPRVLEVLCAAGADLRARDYGGHAPINFAHANAQKDSGETVRVLVANGVRLSTVSKGHRRSIAPELEAFERGVLCCRAAVVAMLRVKRAAKLWMWDKFLLAEMAVCIWSTRYAEEWQTATHE